MIVITASTGHIGSAVLRQLLTTKEKLRVIARDPSKLAPEVRERAQIVKGSHDDEQTMLDALADAAAVFHLVPPDFKSTDDNAHAMRFTIPLIRALEKHGPRHVVSVSGICDGPGTRAGPVSAAYVKDRAIEATGTPFRALECPGFMENTLMSLQQLKHHGSFAWPHSPNHRMPLVATRDIGVMAAQLLANRTWSGVKAQGVLGPADITMNEMAQIMTDVLGKPIAFVSVPADAYEKQLVQHGASPQFAHGLVEMHIAKENGLDSTIRRDHDNTTPTTFRQFCEDTLKPAFLRA